MIRALANFAPVLVVALPGLIGCGSDTNTPGPTGPTCSDVVKNGAESDIDCGGGTCAACPTGKQCIVGSDCQSGLCSSLHCTDAECDDPTACPGSDTECQTRTCDGGTCGVSYTTEGTPIAAQTPGDCRKVVCNGAGGTENAIDNTDLPVDGNDCTDDVCTGGVPDNPFLDPGTPCGTDLMCDGAGSCVGCLDESTCPGDDNECQSRTCIDNTCGIVNNPDTTTPLADQVDGDCHVVVCDGEGGTQNVVDDTDKPIDDNPCTQDLCTGGHPTNPPEGLGSITGCEAPLYCDGSGHCVECLTYEECGDASLDNACGHRTCTDGVCGMAFVPDSDPATTQAPGDCHTVTCDGAGVPTNTVDDLDKPVDGDPCTRDVCTDGAASHPLEDPGFPCGNGVCDSLGACVDCLVAHDCAQPLTECATVDCLPDNTCSYTYVAADVPTVAQTPGDCQQTQCTGGDAIKSVTDDTDKPVDDNPCTYDICQAGVASNPPVPENTTCGDSAACNAAADCTFTFMVVRVGDGSGALSSSSAPVFVEERWIDGSLVTQAGNPIALPIAASGANQPFTQSGTVTSEGNLSRSVNRNYVTLAGFAAAPGTLTVARTTAAATNRVVARIDAAYQVDTSTRLSAAFDGAAGSNGDARSAVSVDGSAFWVGGTSGSGSSGGVHYVAFGSTGASVNLYSTPNPTRFCDIFAGQLYCDAASGAYQSVFTVGTGLPTTGSQATVMLPGLPTASGPSPYGFVLLDSGDTLYVADDSSVGNGGGIQRWDRMAGTWSPDEPYVAATNPTGIRGLAGVTTTLGNLLIGTTTATSGNSIVVVLDDGSGPPPFTVVAAAPTNTAFRRVALSPRHVGP